MSKRVYESVVVFDGVLPEDALRKEIETVTALLGGEAAMQKVEEWGRRELAYTIRKRKSGYYVLYVYEADGTVPAKLTRAARLNENMLRYLTVVNDPKIAELQAKRKADMAARATVENPDDEKKSDDETTE